MKSNSILLPFANFADELEQELFLHKVRLVDKTKEYFIVEDLHFSPTWARVTGKNVQKHGFQSIKNAADFLKEQKILWYNCSDESYRRSELIQNQTNKIIHQKFDFTTDAFVQKYQWGLWALKNETTLYYSSQTNQITPGNLVFWNETQIPPSRAYLKLWELFKFYLKDDQRKNQTALELGAAPGGWTWVLAQVYKSVVAVDKAPLATEIEQMAQVSSLKKDAFKLRPEECDKIDVLYSDLICEPEKLYELILRWKQAGVKKFVCTIKYKGKTDFATTQKFLNIPDSRVIHLNANKHEVTWIHGWS